MSSRLTRKLVKALDPKYILNKDTREKEIEERIKISKEENERRKRFLKRSSVSIPEENSLVDNVEDTTSSTPDTTEHEKVKNIRERFRKGFSNVGTATRKGFSSAKEALGKGARATRKRLANLLDVGSNRKFPRKKLSYKPNVNPKFKKSTAISKIGTPENIGYTGESTSTVYQTNQFSGENPMILNNEVNLK